MWSEGLGRYSIKDILISINTKSEARSTKQIQNPNDQMFKTQLFENTCRCFGHLKPEPCPQGGESEGPISIFGFRIYLCTLFLNLGG